MISRLIKRWLGCQKKLLPIAVLHAILGDGSSSITDGIRDIVLANNDRTVLELVAKRLEEEFGVKGPISPDKGAWRYQLSGEGAKKLAEAIIEVLEETAPQIKALYDLLANGSKYVLIWFEKWARIIKVSKYILNESKVEFVGIAWTPSFTNGGIELKIKTDAEYAERMRSEVEAQGITVVITKGMRRDKVYYDVRIRWSVLKKYICNEELKIQLIRSAMKSIENCKLRNMLNKGRKRDCNSIPPAKWLQRLTDPQWLREHLGCPDS